MFIYISIIAAVLASALSGGAVWYVTQKQVSQLSAEVENKDETIRIAQRAVASSIESQRVAQELADKRASDYRAANVGLVGLRRDLTLTISKSGPSCTPSVSVVADVFEQCAERYIEVARDADEYQDAVKILHDQLTQTK